MPPTNEISPETIISSDEPPHLLVDPDMLYLVARNFASHPTSTATLRHYRFLSLSIDWLKLDLECHHLEQQAILESRTFRTKIQPIADEYRQMHAFIGIDNHLLHLLYSPSTTTSIHLLQLMIYLKRLHPMSSVVPVVVHQHHTRLALMRKSRCWKNDKHCIWQQGNGRIEIKPHHSLRLQRWTRERQRVNWTATPPCYQQWSITLFPFAPNIKQKVESVQVPAPILPSFSFVTNIKSGILEG